MFIRLVKILVAASCLNTAVLAASAATVALNKSDHQTIDEKVLDAEKSNGSAIIYLQSGTYNIDSSGNISKIEASVPSQ